MLIKHVVYCKLHRNKIKQSNILNRSKAQFSINMTIERVPHAKVCCSVPCQLYKGKSLYMCYGFCINSNELLIYFSLY